MKSRQNILMLHCTKQTSIYLYTYRSQFSTRMYAVVFLEKCIWMCRWVCVYGYVCVYVCAFIYQHIVKEGKGYAF